MYSATPNHAKPKSFSDILTLHTILALIAVEGIFALLASLATPSTERRAIILGLSASRLALEAALLLIVLSTLGVLIKFVFDTQAARNTIATLQAFIQREPTRLWTIISIMISASIAGFYFFALQRFFPSTKAPDFINILFLHFSAALLWLAAIPLQLAFSILFICRASIRPAAKLILTDPTPSLWSLAMLAGAIQCITLFLRSNLLFSIPGWFWRITPKSYQPALLLFSPFAIAALVGARYIIRKNPASSRQLIFSTALILMLQIAFGVAAGNGLESLRLKYAKAPISHEARVACEYPNGALSAIKDYESNFGDDFWLGTKPPGLLALFITLRDATYALSSKHALKTDQCFDMITKVMGVIFPLLASLVLLPIYYLSRMLAQKDHPHDPAILYMSAPAVLLMPLIRDQAIYPFLAACALAVIVKAALSRSMLLAVTAGVLLYLSAFFSFSLLPIAGLAIAFHAIIGFRDRDRFRLSQTFMLMSALAIGAALAWVAGNALLSYDPIGRYQTAIQHHRAIKNFLPDPLSLLRNASINSLEFVMATGAPIIILFLISTIKSIMSVFRKAISNSDVFALAILCTFTMLHIIGQTRGETARLWLFMIAPVTVIAAIPARHMQTKINSTFIFIFAMQILISFITFTNMDFR